MKIKLKDIYLFIRNILYLCMMCFGDEIGMFSNFVYLMYVVIYFNV